MQEITSPSAVDVAANDTPARMFAQLVAEHPDRPALAHRVGNQFVDVTTRQFGDEVRALAKGLVAQGVEVGDRVCVMAHTRIEWTWLDFAIWAAGGVTVPIYETSASDQIEWIAGNSDAVVIVLEDARLKERYDVVAAQLANIKAVFVIEDGGLDELKASGADVDDSVIDKRSQAATGDDLATLVYTSGTTGMPKGCHITHGNLMFDVRQAVAVAEGILESGGSTLFFLPLAHIFARMLEVGCVAAGVKIGFATGIPQLVEELGMFRPTFAFSVPRVFEKVYNTARQRAKDDGKERIFDKAVDVAIDHSRETMAGGVSLKTRVLHALFDRLVYGKLRDIFGGQCTDSISGGAPLGERLGHFYNGIGVTVYEGYGLTETSAGHTLNRPGAIRIGSVGTPLPGCSVRIADDGEVMLRGDNVFKGYWKNDQATQESIEREGWFHSGDLGRLDDDGFLYITGRKKEIIVTAGGKNVAPAVLEDRLRAHALVSQCMVVGDNQPFIGALVTIDPDVFPAWANEHGKSGKSIADLTEDDDLKAAIQEAVNHANQAVSKAEAIKEFRILPEDFTIETGEMTPSLKVKRNVVVDKYGSYIEEIYATVQRI